MERDQIEQAIADVATRLDASVSAPAVQDLDNGLSLLDRVETYLTRSVYGGDGTEDSGANIVVLGTTGAGKSTVVSFLFGKGNVFVKHEGQYSRALDASQPLPGVVIRSGSVSSTLLPVVNHVGLGETSATVWDMPGSRDTRGPFVELVVHFIFKWMLVDNKPLRFVIVSPPLLERPQIVALQDLINGSLVNEENTVVVYTKCSTDFDPRSTADLKIHESKKSIRSFAMPAPVSDNHEGHDYSKQYRNEKQQMLDGITKLKSHAVTFDEPLPDAAQILLDKFCESSIAFAREKLSECFVAAYDWGCYRGTLTEMRDTLQQLRSQDALSLDAAINVLERIVPAKLGRLQSDSEVVEASRRLSLVGILLGEQLKRPLVGWLTGKCVLKLEDAKEKLVVLINSVNSYRHVAKLGDTAKILAVSAFHLRLSEEQKRIEKFVGNRQGAISSWSDIPTVIVVGFASLEVDVALKLWANLALVSPLVKVATKTAFTLSAVGQAQCLPTANTVAGKDGEHGQAGLPGGNLVVVSNTLIDDDQKFRATMSCGQQGGDAQNGGNGVDGVDSCYTLGKFQTDIDGEIERGLLSDHIDNNMLPKELKSSPQLFVSVYIDESSPLSGRVYGIPGKKTWKLYKPSEAGTRGVRPGRGGRGGAGGKSGKISLVQPGKSVWEGSCCPGKPGQDGIAGAPARDGCDSSSFAATIEQWYAKGGWFRDSFSEPLIKTEETKIPMPEVMEAKPVNGNGPDAEPNPNIDMPFVKAKFQLLRSRLENKFPQCDFSDLGMWFGTSYAQKSMNKQAAGLA